MNFIRRALGYCKVESTETTWCVYSEDHFGCMVGRQEQRQERVEAVALVQVGGCGSGGERRTPQDTVVGRERR